MSVTITDTELRDWEGFFAHPDVNVQASLDPAAAGTGSSKIPKIVNNRFFSQSFDASQNNARFSKSPPAGADCLLLGLKKDAGFTGKPLTSILQAAGVPDNELGVAKQSANVFERVISMFTGTSPTNFVLTDTQEISPTFEQKRNAMWLTPGDSLRLDTVMTFSPATTTVNALKSEIEDVLPISLGSLEAPTLIVQRTSRGVKLMTSQGDDPFADDALTASTPTWNVTTTYRVTWKLVIDSFVLWISLEPMGYEVSLTAENSDGTSLASSFWSSITQRVPFLQGLGIKPESTEGILNDINLLRVTYRKVDGQQQWQVVASVTLPGGGPDIYLGYDTRSSTFSGGLIVGHFYSTDDDLLLPEYTPGEAMAAPSTKTIPEFWDLGNFFPNVKIPPELPTGIVLASVSYSKSSTNSVLRLQAQARRIADLTGKADTDMDGQKTIPSPFTWDELDVSFTKSKNKVSCSLSTYFTLHPPPQSTIPPARFGLSFEYDDGGWELHGYVENLSASLLYQFFDADTQNAALEVFGKLNIASLDLLWTHTAGGKNASFLFSGRITFGELELRLFYQYVTKDADAKSVAKVSNALQGAKGGPGPAVVAALTDTESTWMFECDLGSSTENATIATIADSIIENASENLPSFVSNIPIPKADDSNGRAPISIKAKKVFADTTTTSSTGTSVAKLATGSESGDSGGSTARNGKVIFVFRLAIESFSLMFVQVADVPAKKGDKAQPTKRLLRFAVDKLPVKDNIPLLDRLPQPFDQLEYVWVNKTGGFTKEEVDMVNQSGLLSAEDFLVYQGTSKEGTNHDNPPRAGGETTESPSPPTNPVVLQQGHHFMVLNEGKVVVDHIFFASSAEDDKAKKTQPQPTPHTIKARALVAGDETSVDSGTAVTGGEKQQDPSKPAKGSLSFKLGPLAVDAVTLQYKEQAGKKSLVLTLNATFTMGPIVFSLLGFGVSVSLDGSITLNNLRHAIDDISVSLAGLALSFNKPPLLVAGGFEHKFIQNGTEQQEVFLGGIGVSYPPYTFVGLGEYAIVTVGNSSYKSVFLFAKLDGPLITLSFATISGVRLGLGYNSYVSPPTIDQITQFPFINDRSISGAGNDPMTLLKKMTDADNNAGGKIWVQPKLNSYWFAAGMSIIAFDILTVTAVAMFAFRDSGLVISLYADAIAEMPPNSAKGAAIVYVEIGMVAEMNFADGYFRVEASLAPTSYLLVPQCHLYGGFALVYWFPPSEHAGDWVFSIGGYHRAYTPPTWYPVPTRLGISFNIDIISITGESYFAVTPKCVMGGAMMHCSLAFGPIEAWMDYSFDALINFHPLHYRVEFAVSIGVNFNIDILFIHIHISVHVGAQLRVEGPEFGGVAHVDFYLFGFDVDFGASPTPPAPLDLYEFFLLLHKPGPDPSSDASVKHAAPLLSWFEINSTKDDGILSSVTDALIHTTKRLVNTHEEAAHKFILENGNFPMPKDPDTSGGETTSTGAGTKWFVKGGSFQFRISTDFAINDATLTTQDSGKPRHPDQPKTKASKAKTDTDDPSLICAKPMQITSTMGKSTQSSLVITVKREISTNIFDPVPISKWRTFSLLPKPMPNAIWGAYDRLQDPSKNQRPDTLLNGNDATTSQYMSVSLSAPPPELCPRPEWPGFIPKFKATAAARFGIRDFRKGGAGTDWFVPKSEPTQKNYLPKVLSAEEKAKKNNDRWEGMMNTWAGLETESKQTVVKGLLDQVSSALGWDQKRSQLETKDRQDLVNALVKEKEKADQEEQAKGKDKGETPDDGATDGKGKDKNGKDGTDSSAADGNAKVQVQLPDPWRLTGRLPDRLIKNMKAMYLDLPRLAVDVSA